MGAGKTTIGRILSKRLSIPFKDTDEFVEESEGMSIMEIFQKKGEDYFRTVEQRIILSTPNEGERVLAVGGGGFNEKTIPFLKKLGPTIFLDLSFEEVKRRISIGKKRPHAEDRNLFALFLKRKSFYSRAHYTVWTESLTVDEVVETVLRLI